MRPIETVAIGMDNQATIKTREKLRFGAGRHSVKKDRIIGACEELRRRRSDVTVIIRLAPKGHRKQGRWMRRQADRKGDFEKVDREREMPPAWIGKRTCKTEI